MSFGTLNSFVNMLLLNSFTVESTSQHLNSFVLLFLNYTHQNKTTLFKMSPQLASVDFPSSKHYKTLTYLSICRGSVASNETYNSSYLHEIKV